jgi:hypothetical protein
MAKRRRVVVRGGGSNLYEIDEYDGSFTAYRVRVSLLGDSRDRIGTAGSLEDAFSLIKSHSGRQIASVD